MTTPPPDTTAPWRPWLARVATRLAIDALRHRRTRRYVGPWLPSPVETPAGATHGELASELDAEARYGLRESVSFAFLRALEVLDPTPRATLVLRDVLGYSGPETAEILEVSPGNVRVILHRARAALARYDAKRQPPSPEVDRRHQEALQRFMLAWMSGDAQQITACVAEDVRVSSDGAGRYRAATKPVVGQDNVVRFLLGLLRHSAGPAGQRATLAQRASGHRQPHGHRAPSGCPACVHDDGCRRRGADDRDAYRVRARQAGGGPISRAWIGRPPYSNTCPHAGGVTGSCAVPSHISSSISCPSTTVAVPSGSISPGS